MRICKSKLKQIMENNNIENKNPKIEQIKKLSLLF